MLFSTTTILARLFLEPDAARATSTPSRSSDQHPAEIPRRGALQSAAASAKILRLNADEAALRHLCFAVGDPLGPAANVLSLWRDCAAQPPRPSPDPRRGGAAGSGHGPERPRIEPEGLRRRGRSAFGGRKGWRPGALRRPGRQSALLRNVFALGI